MIKSLSKKAPRRVGPFLQQARVDAGFTQADVAKVLGYTSAQFVSDWERGVRSPPARALRRLVKLYKISVHDLYEVLHEERVALIEKELKKDLFG